MSAAAVVRRRVMVIDLDAPSTGEPVDRCRVAVRSAVAAGVNAERDADDNEPDRREAR
jgi:hypothetical protein